MSNPTNPSLLSRFNLDSASYGINVVSSIAYVANYNGMQLINVSNPSNPSLLGNFKTQEMLHDVSVVGSIAYVTDFSSGLQIFDVSRGFANPLGLNILGNKFINGAFTLGNTIFYTEQDKGLVVVDSLNITISGIYSVLATGVSVVGSIAYVANCYGGLQLVNVSDPIIQIY